MKRLAVLIITVLFLFIREAFAQDWAAEEFSKFKPDTVIAVVNNYMKNEIGNKHPDFVFRELDKDSALTLENFKGSIVILNFWSPGCSGCRWQIPKLSQIQEDFGKDGLKVIYISNASKKSQKEFFGMNKAEGIKVIIDRKEVKKMRRPYQTIAEPTAYIIDSSGIVRDAWMVPQEYEVLKEKVLMVMNKNKAE